MHFEQKVTKQTKGQGVLRSLRLLLGTPAPPKSLNPKTEVEMGSARASRAVFRALAENIERAKKTKGSGERCAPKGWTRGASSNTRGRVCSPTPVFGLKFHCKVRRLSAIK